MSLLLVRFQGPASIPCPAAGRMEKGNNPVVYFKNGVCYPYFKPVRRDMRRRRGVLIFTVMVAFFSAACSEEPGIQKKKFEKPARAAQAVKASLAAGASCRQFDESLQKLSSEIAAVKSTLTSKKEKDLLAAYSDLSAIYQDSLLLWKYKIRFARFSFVPKGRIYVGQDVEPIVMKYHFATESHVYPSTQQYWKSIAEDSIRIIWSNADSQFKVIENITNY